MKKNIFIIVIIFFVFSFSASAIYAQQDKYFFYPFSGRSVLSRTQGGTWLALQPGQPMELHPGDIINVEGDGKGEIVFPDGTSVRMKNNAMVTLSRYSINLRFGYVWLNVRRSADVFKVITPLGSCSVLGTSFDVDVDKYGKTKVRVFKGIVAVRASDDKSNKQLVLQNGMQTLISDSNKVNSKPDKFQYQSLEAEMKSEWEQRSFYGFTPGKLRNKSLVEELADKRSNKAPIVTSNNELPLIRSEKEMELEFKPIEKILDKEPENLSVEKGKVKILARQRSEFAEMLRQQQLERDSVIGFSIPQKADMMKEGHAVSFGEMSRTKSSVTDHASLEREYALIRNRLLRVQSLIRQTEMELGSLCSRNDNSTGNNLKISYTQRKLSDLRAENRVLTSKLHELQHKKR